MLQYSANDIMERAEQYANKESSSVYSYAEKVSMLNEAWQELYQILVNTGDKYWINKFTFEGTSVELPKDLYQIAAVKRNNELITNYELNNNELIFKTPGTYEVEYYPNPKTLYFKMKMKKSVFQPPKSNDINEPYFFKAGKDGTFIYQKKNIAGSQTSSRTVYIYNSVSKTTDTVSFSGTDVVLYENAILGYTEYYSFKTGIKSLFNGNPVIFNNNLFFYQNGKIIDDTGKEVTEYTPDPSLGGYFKLVTSDFEDFKAVFGHVKTIGDEFVYINSSGQLVHVDRDGNDTLIYTKYKPIGFEDNMLITYDSLSKIFFNESIYNDTIISYPSNVYITILALNIAMKMRAKQGIDNEQLNAQYSMAMSNLYNTIDRDKNKNLVIKDVYNTNTYSNIIR